jgi:hypothetical protein
MNTEASDKYLKESLGILGETLVQVKFSEFGKLNHSQL